MTISLISCSNCGVVLDSNHISWPKAGNFEEVPLDRFEWDGAGYVGLADCPVCGEPIRDPDFSS